MEAFLKKNRLQNILLVSPLTPVPLVAQPAQQAPLLSGILRTAAGTPLAGPLVRVYPLHGFQPPNQPRRFDFDNEWPSNA
jgi:hypothetical protein